MTSGHAFLYRDASRSPLMFLTSNTEKSPVCFPPAVSHPYIHHFSGGLYIFSPSNLVSRLYAGVASRSRSSCFRIFSPNMFAGICMYSCWNASRLIFCNLVFSDWMLRLSGRSGSPATNCLIQLIVWYTGLYTAQYSTTANHLLSFLSELTRHTSHITVPITMHLPVGSSVLYTDDRNQCSNFFAICGFSTSLFSCGSSTMISVGLLPLTVPLNFTASIETQFINWSCDAVHFLFCSALFLSGTSLPNMALIFMLFSNSSLILPIVSIPSHSLITSSMAFSCLYTMHRIMKKKQ